MLMGKLVVIDYTNHRGERSERIVDPIELIWWSNKWHPEEQWLLEAVDVDKGQRRTFSMKDIHSWRPYVSTENLPIKADAAPGDSRA